MSLTSGDLEHLLDDAARILERASSLLVMSGSGLSAESGLPTYRGVGGLYEHSDTEDGMPIEVALSGPMLYQRPDIIRRYLNEIAHACRHAAPSEAHRVIAAFERRIPRTWVLTQNVDGLHLAAGSRNVIELHGNIHRLRCPRCGARAPVAATDNSDGPDGPERWDPPCAECGTAMRPDVVLFEELLPKAALELYQRELARGFDAILVVGTTATFPYISGPVYRAAREGVPTIEVNPGESEVSHFVTVRLATTAGRAFDGIKRRLALG